MHAPRQRTVPLQTLLAAAFASPIAIASPAWAQVDLTVANPSFEAPQTFFAYPDAEEWEETGPVSEDPQLPGVKDTLDTGVFFNSPVDGEGNPSPFFVTNADGNQLGFIFAKDDDDIAFFQQLADPYEVGAAYTFNLLVGESFFFPPLTYNPNKPDPPPDPDPALIAIRLYYVDKTMQHVVIGERIVSADEMPDGPDSGVLLVNMAATTGFAQPADPWVGEPIGIEIRPVDGLSGVWNLDLARVSVDCGPLGAPGDANLDGQITIDDHAALIACLTGPGESGRPGGCPPCAFSRLDTDGDGNLDLRDFAAMARDFEQ